jgi:hypothetical protein
MVIFYFAQQKEEMYYQLLTPKAGWLLTGE